MCGARYLLSQHPEVEAQVVAELEGLQLLATPERPHPRALAAPDLGKLPYLSCVIKVGQHSCCCSNPRLPADTCHVVACPCCRRAQVSNLLLAFL